MADGSTTNHGFILPEVGLAKSTWGNSLNSNWSALDQILDTGGNGLFVAKTGGTMSGALGVTEGTEAAPGVQWDNPNNGIYWDLGDGPSFTAAGSTIGQLRGGTALAEAYSIVTRQAGDNRYLKLSGGTMAGDLAVNGSISSGPAGNDVIIGHGGSNAYLDNNGPGAIIFRQGGTNVIEVDPVGTVLLHRAGNGMVDWSNGDLYFRKNGTTIGVLRENAQNLAGNTILRTPGADGRYIQKSWSVGSGDGLVGGGDGESDRTISMGTPSDITKASVNSASGSTHTHRILASDFRDMAASWLVHNQIGSLVLAIQVSGGEIAYGGTMAGGQLRPSTTGGSNNGTGLSGTWRCMGYCPDGGDPTTLWMRIA